MRTYVVWLLASSSIMVAAAPALANGASVDRSFKSVTVTKTTGYFPSIWQPDREVELDLNEGTKPPAQGCPITTFDRLSGCIGR